MTSAGYVHMSETAVWKCTTEASSRKCVDVGVWRLLWFWFICAVALACFVFRSHRCFQKSCQCIWHCGVGGIYCVAHLGDAIVGLPDFGEAI